MNASRGQRIAYGKSGQPRAILQVPDEPLEERHLALCRGVRVLAESDGCGHNVMALETKLLMLQLSEATHQQSAGNQQDRADCYLANHKPLPER